jgi:thiol-disulfide isomerase/thioredoxin
MNLCCYSFNVRRKLPGFIGVLFMLTAASVTHAQEVLNIRFNNLPDGVAYLKNATTAKIDTVPIRNHTLYYTTKLGEPALFFLAIGKINTFENRIMLVLSAQPTKLRYDSIKATHQGTWQSLYPNYPSYIADPNNNALLDQFGQIVNTFSDRVTALAPKGDEKDTTLEQRKVLYQEFLHTMETQLTQHANKPVAAAALFELLVKNGLTNLEQTRTLFGKFSEAVRYGAVGTPLGAYINQELGLEPGQPAPDFELKDAQGRTYTLASFNKKVLLHFWSSTCGPCREENTEVARLQAANKGHLVVVNISLDTDRARWLAAIQKDGLQDMVNLCDFKGGDTVVKKSYGVHGIPTFFLIGPDKTMVSRGRLSNVRVLALEP